MTAPQQAPQIETRRFESIDSTNNAAKRLIERRQIDEDAALMLVADEQTAGRGRGDRSWASPRGGLWATLLWPARLSPTGVLEGLGLRIGLALTRTVERHLALHGHGDPAKLKWPNDVFVGGKKIAGALTELYIYHSRTWILVGCGINADLSVSDLPGELAGTATTLRDLIGGSAHTDRLLAPLTEELRAALLTEGLPADTMELITERLHGVGDTSVVRRAGMPDRRGTFVGLNPDGSAIFIGESGTPFNAPTGVEILPS